MKNEAKIVKKTYTENITLRNAALKLNLITNEEIDKWVKPEDMIGAMD